MLINKKVVKKSTNLALAKLELPNVNGLAFFQQQVHR